MHPKVDIKHWKLRKTLVENQLIDSLTKVLNEKDVTEFGNQLSQLPALEQLYQELPNATSDATFKNRKLRKFLAEMCKSDENTAFVGAFLAEIPIVNEILVKMDKQRPLHIAVQSNAFKMLQTLLGIPGVDVNVTWKNQTSLMLLLRNVTSDNFVSVKQTINLLAQKKADINICDFKSHPLSVICHSASIDEDKKYELIKLCGKIFSCDVDSEFDGQARKDIEAHNWDIDFGRMQPILTTAAMKFQLLKGNEQGFVERFGNLYKEVTRDNVGDICDLLYQASAKNRVQCVEAIFVKLKNRSVSIPPEGRKKIADAIKLVCREGYAKVLKMYLDNIKKAMASVFNESCLVLICVRKLHRKESADMMECMNHLLNDVKINVEKADHLGTSALHFALQYNMDSVALKILTCGRKPYIGQLNRFSKSPLHLMNATVLKKYLDSCISTMGDSSDNIKEIIINFEGFLPPSVHNSELKYTRGPSQVSLENGVSPSPESLPLMNDRPDTESQSVTDGTERRRHNTKRTNLRRLESVNQIPPNEIDPFEYIASSKELRPLLSHPTLTAILLVKWCQIQWIQYALLALSVVQAIMLTLYAIVPLDSYCSYILRICCALFFFLFIIVFFLMNLNKRTDTTCTLSLNLSSVKGGINYLDALIVSGAFLSVVFCGHDNTSLSILIVLSGINVVLHMGSLPFATLTRSIAMLETISMNFFKSILIYLVILVAFGFGFFVLFASSNTRVEQDSDRSDEFSKFKTLINSFVKTAVMLTGEFDAASFDFEANGASYLLFFGFLFLVVLVVANLINGIAVSDISAIRQEADILALAKKVETLAHYERMDNTFSANLFKPFKLAFLSFYEPNLIINAQLGYTIEARTNQGSTKRFYRWPLTKSLRDRFNLSDCYKLDKETANTIQEILDTRKSSNPESYDVRLARLEEKLDQLIALMSGAGAGRGRVGSVLESSAQMRWKRAAATLIVHRPSE